MVTALVSQVIDHMTKQELEYCIVFSVEWHMQPIFAGRFDRVIYFVVKKSCQFQASLVYFNRSINHIHSSRQADKKKNNYIQVRTSILTGKYE